jgi:excisionase family DNA binding protein
MMREGMMKTKPKSLTEAEKQFHEIQNRCEDDPQTAALLPVAIRELHEARYKAGVFREAALRSRDEIAEEKAVAKGVRQIVLKHAVIAKLNHSQPTLRKMADASTFEDCEAIRTAAVEAANRKAEEKATQRLAEESEKKTKRAAAQAEKARADEERARHKQKLEEAKITLAEAERARSDMFTLQDAAMYCNCCDRTIRNWIRDDRLPGVNGRGRLTLIPRSSLDQCRKSEREK